MASNNHTNDPEAQNPPPTAPAPAQPAPAQSILPPNNTTQPPTNAPASPPSPSPFVQALDAGEQHWPWKLSLRAILLIIVTIGIGTTAWAVARSGNALGTGFTGYDYFFDSYYMPWGLIPLSLSFVWCGVAILVLLLRKRPVHPGAAVGLDLVLWLALIVTGLFAVASVVSVTSFGEGGMISDPSYSHSDYSGEYVFVPSNNSWVYNITYVSNSGGSDNYYYNYTTMSYEYNTTTPDTSNVTRDCTPEFTSCADQDAFINALWHDKQHREGVLLASTTCQWLAVLLHFVLFVWACVDTNRRNRSKKGDQAQLIAEKIIEDMQKKGQLTLHAPMTRPLLAPGSVPGSRGTSASVRRGDGVVQQRDMVQAAPVQGSPSVASADPDAIEKAPARFA